MEREGLALRLVRSWPHAEAWHWGSCVCLPERFNEEEEMFVWLPGANSSGSGGVFGSCQRTCNP